MPYTPEFLFSELACKGRRSRAPKSVVHVTFLSHGEVQELDGESYSHAVHLAALWVEQGTDVKAAQVYRVETDGSITMPAVLKVRKGKP